RSRVFLSLRADERAVLHPRHIRRIRGTPEAVRPQLRVQPGEGPVLDEQAGQPVPFGLRAVTPDDRVRLGQLRDLIDPPGQLGQLRCCRFIARACAGHDNHSRRGLTCGGTHNFVRVDTRLEPGTKREPWRTGSACDVSHTYRHTYWLRPSVPPKCVEV